MALAALLISLCFLWVTVGLPLMALAFEALQAPSGILDPSVLAIARFTLLQASLSAAISVALGVPLGLWAERYWSTRWAPWIRAVLLVPFGVPTVAAGMAWIGFLRGIGSDLPYSLEALILAHVFYNVPWVAWLVAEAAHEVPLSQRESMRLLGAGFRDELIALTWQRIRGAVASGFAQVMSLCAMSFGLVMILGGGPPVSTLETALYSRVRYGTLDLGGAIGCAFWQIAVSLLPWLLVSRWIRPIRTPRVEPRRVPPETSVLALICLGACAVFLVPYLSVFQGFRPSSLREVEWAAALFDSARIALLSSAISVFVAGCATLASRSFRFPEILFVLPAGVSVLVLALGSWLAYGEWIDPFEGSFAAIVLLQSAVFFPVAFRLLYPFSTGVRGRLLDAAALLGASPFRAFMEVEWIRWKGPVLGAFALGTAAGLAEIAAVSFFFSEKLVPASLLITRLKAQYQFEAAETLSALLMLLSVAMSLGVSRAGGFHAVR